MYSTHTNIALNIRGKLLYVVVCVRVSVCISPIPHLAVGSAAPKLQCVSGEFDL